MLQKPKTIPILMKIQKKNKDEIAYNNTILHVYDIVPGKVNDSKTTFAV